MRRAAAVPDEGLRHAAVETLAAERGNLEGAAAFAVYAPRDARCSVIEALVFFQAVFDFADTLAEQPVADPSANARALHQALLDACSSPGSFSAHYSHSRDGDDGGYLRGLVSSCQAALASQPSYPVVEERLRHAVGRMVAYQTFVHDDDALALTALARWARDETPAGSDLRWWEAAAAGASSLVAFALIAAAAKPALAISEVEAIEATYFPWGGSLHVLLDSLVDLPQDMESGHRSLVAHYASPEEAANRMEAIGRSALRSAEALPQAHQHTLCLVAMAGFYLAKPAARLPHAAESTSRLIRVLGALVWPVLLVHRTRRWIGLRLDRSWLTR